MSSSSDAACTSAGCEACMSLIAYEEGSAPSFLMTRGSVYLVRVRVRVRVRARVGG